MLKNNLFDLPVPVDPPPDVVGGDWVEGAPVVGPWVIGALVVVAPLPPLVGRGPGTIKIQNCKVIKKLK